MALVLENGQSIPQVARDLDLVDSAFRRWIYKAPAGRVSPGPAVVTGSQTAEQAELQQLRREIQSLRMEREILKKATASSPRNRAEMSVHCGAERALPRPDPMSAAGCEPHRLLRLAASPETSERALDS